MQEEIKNYFEVKERVYLMEQAVIELKDSNREIKLEMREFRKMMHSNFVWFLGIMLGGFLSLFGLMAHGFKWL